MPRVLALRALFVLTAILALPCSSALAAAPAGDSFSSPEVLTGTDATAEADTTDATAEAGEPTIGGQYSYGSASVWYSWTAPEDGTVGIDTAGSSYDTIVGVYTGEAIAHLNEIAWNNDAASNTRISRLAFRATAGTTYRILVDGTSASQRGALKLTLRERQPPPNDAFANATELPSEYAATAFGDTLAATTETGEPAHHPYVQPRRTVWYSWTAPAKGALTVSATRQLGVIPLLAAYTGDTVASLTRVRNQPQDYEGVDRIRLRVEAGVTYRIAVEGYLNGGEFQLSLELVDAPANDDFADSLPLEGEVAEVAGSTVGATSEDCEPVHEENYWDPSVWYHWTAPADGGVVIDSAGSDFPTVLAAYTGTDLCKLTRVPTARLTTTGPARRSFRVKAGETYRIAVDGQRARMGNYKLSLRWTPPPPNDMIEDAETLSGDSASASGTTLGATREPGEPSYGYEGASVWYSWTAPTSGEAKFSFGAGTTSDANLQVMTRSATGELKSIAYNGVGFRAVPGTTYLVMVDGWTRSNHVDFTLNLVHKPSPPNDDFAAATLLAGSEASASGTNVGATTETGEPRPSDEYGRGSVWFRWTATADGTVAIDTEGSPIDTVLGVYTGAAVNALTTVATNNNATSSKKTSRVTFHVTAGTTYHVLLDSYYDVRGDYGLHLTHRTRPSNDAFANATPLPSEASASAFGSNLAATAETGEPSHLSYYTPRASVWYAWTAPSGGSLTIRANQDSFQPVLAAYTGGTLTGLARVPNQAQDWNGGPEQIRVRVQAGTTYYIAVDASGSLGGDFNLTLELIPSPANDDFGNAQPIDGVAVDVEGSTVGATQEPCEPVHDSNYYDPSVWYTWTAPETGAVTLDSAGSEFPTVLAVYTGDALCSLVRQPMRILSAAGSPSKRGFRAIAGRTYRIAVDGVRGKWGRYRLSLRHSPPPANDLLANAQELTGTVAEASGTNFGATAETGEPGPAGGATVWYRWTAPHTGLARVELPTRFNGSGLGVYTGDAPQSLVKAGIWDSYYFESYTAHFRAEEGRTYKIVVGGGSAPQQGEFTLRLTSLPAPANDDFANAEPLAGEMGRIEATIAGATWETGEPRHSEYGDDRGSVWYTWTAPESGLIEMRTSGATSGYGTIASYIYAGDSLQTLRLLGRGSFRAVKGETYRIAVAGKETVAGGGFALAWRTIGPPANDAFAAAMTVEGPSIARHGTTVGATMEPGEPASNASSSYRRGATVWYRWTAPSTGLAALSTSSDSHATAYEGDGLTSLQMVASTYYYESYFRAEAGSTYWVRVEGGLLSTSGAFTFNLRLIDRPANDDFADAAPLSDRSLRNGTTTGATSERGEPLRNGRATVWYRWTAERTGTAVLDTPSSYDHGLALYGGDSLGTLERRAGVSGYGGALRTRVVAGRTYRIAVDGEPTSYARGFMLAADILPGPPNDDFADAEELAGVTDLRGGSNVNATLEPGEPTAGYGYADDGRTVWYRWTAPTSGRVTVDLSGSGFDTTLAAFEGSSVRALKKLGSDNDSGDGSTSLLSIQVRAGSTYAFSVGSYGSTGGEVKLRLSHQQAPLNDDFAGATPLTGSLVVSGDNTAATAEPDEPQHDYYEKTHASLWYAWTAPSNGRVTLDLTASPTSANAYVYDGASLGSLKLVKRNYSWSYEPKKLTFDARRGKTYRIAVDTYPGRRGAVTMSITHLPAPPNDDLAEAQTLFGHTATVAGSNVNATREPGEEEAYSSYRGTVWYRWTAPGSGPVRIGIRDATFYPAVDVYTGTGGFAGQRVTSGSTGASFTAVKGVTYVVSVYGQTSPEGPFTLDLNLYEPPPNDRFADAATLTGPAVDVAGTTVNGSREYCEPQHDPDYFDPSVWYTWTAAVGGTVTVDVVGTGFTPSLGIYTGSAPLCGLAPVPHSTSGNRRSFEAKAGQTYRFAVDSSSGASGPFALSLRLTAFIAEPPPAQDPPADDPALQRPPAQDPPPGDPPAGDPPAEDPPAHDPPSENPPADDPPADDPPADDPPADDPPSEDPPLQKPPAQDPPAGDPPPSDPPSGDPPSSDPPGDDPPTENPPGDDPPAGDPPTDSPPPSDPPASEPPPDDGEDFPIDNPLDPPADDPPSEDPPASDPPSDEPPAGDPSDPPAGDLPPSDPPADDPQDPPPGDGPSEDPPVGDPPSQDPPADDPPSDDPPADSPPPSDPAADDPPAGDTPSETPSDDPPSQDPSGSDPSASDPSASDPSASGPTASGPSGQGGGAAAPDPWGPPGGSLPGPGASGQDPLGLAATFSPKQRIAPVLAKGLAGSVACTRACRVEITVTVDSAAAKKAKLSGSKLTSARLTATLVDGSAQRLTVKLPKAALKKLRGMKVLPLTVRVVATSVGGTTERTLRLKLKR